MGGWEEGRRQEQGRKEVGAGEVIMKTRKKFFIFIVPTFYSIDDQSLAV